MNSFLLLSTDLKTWLDFISSISSSLAWPLAIIIVCIIFKKNISSLIGLLQKIDVKGVSMEFGNKLGKINEQLNEEIINEDNEIKKNKSDETIHSDKKIEKIKELDAIQPYELVDYEQPDFAIVRSFIPIEEALRLFYSKAYKIENTSNLNPRVIIRALFRDKYISPATFDAISTCIKVRNTVTADIDIKASNENAVAFNNICFKILTILKDGIGRLNKN